MLQKKIDQSLRLLDSVQKQLGDSQIEIAFSGGKDSDVILELAKMAGINYVPIYKCTTIDPPGTISHCIKKDVIVKRPKNTFFQLIEKKGFPSFQRRFCCEKLKEYKILDNCIQGIRRCESQKRMANYSEKEPIVCRIYGSKKRMANVILPILSWTNKDVFQFINKRNIECHPLYYDDYGNFHVERRLGCMGCPLAWNRSIQDFVKYPNLVRAWIRAGQVFRDTHKHSEACKTFKSVYDMFANNVFFHDTESFNIFMHNNLFGFQDTKKLLEDYFKIQL